MSELAIEKIFAESGNAPFRALRPVLPHLPKVARNWRAALKALNLDPALREALAGIDLEAAVEKLQGAGYASLQAGVRDLAGELARAGVQIEDAIAALWLILDQSLPYMKRNFEQAAAASRLFGMISAMLGAGYSQHWKASKNSLAKGLADARHRLKDASAYVTQVYEGERRQLSHDLHDEIGHDLMLLKLYIEVMLRGLDKGEAVERSKLDDALGVVTHAIESARRMVLDLGPAIFEELGFLPAIQSYVRQYEHRTGIRVDFQEGPLPEQIPMTHQVAIYRILQGALGNVMKHARASNVKVKLGSIKNAVIVLVIEDDGQGFDLAGSRDLRSVGLMAMRERAEVLGGRFHIESTKAGSLKRGHGTRIEVDLPLPKTRAAVPHYQTKQA
jgi:signal transduction histidine kinase